MILKNLLVAAGMTGLTACATEYSDKTLDTNELRRAFSGTSLAGCYPGGGTWFERTEADGTLKDMNQSGTIVGKWYAAEGQICYIYPGQNEDDTSNCFSVKRSGDGGYNFISGDPAKVVASTSCPISQSATAG